MYPLLQHAQGELLRANADKKHPFRFFTLATMAQYPEVRTVVLRKSMPDFSVVLFTDSRSPKVNHIQTNPHVSALFYHPKKSLQVRIRAKAHLLTEASPDYHDYLNRVKSSPSVSDYSSSLPPGAPLENGVETETSDVLHFQPILLKPDSIDILQLSREGHQRAMYWLEKKEWVERKLAP